MAFSICLHVTDVRASASSAAACQAVSSSLATMQEMFSKAKNPRRVFVGAVQQLLNITEACWRPGKPTLPSLK